MNIPQDQTVSNDAPPLYTLRYAVPGGPSTSAKRFTYTNLTGEEADAKLKLLNTLGCIAVAIELEDPQ